MTLQKKMGVITQNNGVIDPFLKGHGDSRYLPGGNWKDTGPPLRAFGRLRAPPGESQARVPSTPPRRKLSQAERASSFELRVEVGGSPEVQWDAQQKTFCQLRGCGLIAPLVHFAKGC